jgi:ketosteroid isomerase-like protein
MKTCLAMILASLSSTVVLFASPQVTSSATESKALAEKDVRRVNSEEVRAFLNNDSKALAGLWSDDLVVTNPLNKLVNKQQVLGMVESGFLVITSYDRQIEYLRVYGETVIVAGSETLVWGGRMPNAGRTEHLRFSAVWMRNDGTWREVARHANIVPQP